MATRHRKSARCPTHVKRTNAPRPGSKPGWRRRPKTTTKRLYRSRPRKASPPQERRTSVSEAASRSRKPFLLARRRRLVAAARKRCRILERLPYKDTNAMPESPSADKRNVSIASALLQQQAILINKTERLIAPFLLPSEVSVAPGASALFVHRAKTL